MSSTTKQMRPNGRGGGYLSQNSAVEVVPQAILVISFVGDIYCMLDIGPGEASGSCNHIPRSLKINVANSAIPLVFHWNHVSILYRHQDIISSLCVINVTSIDLEQCLLCNMTV